MRAVPIKAVFELNKKSSGEQTDIGFQAKLEAEDKPPKAFLKFNGRLIFNELDPNFVLDFEAPPVKLSASVPSPSEATNTTNSETEITLDFVPGLRDELKEKDEIPDCIPQNATDSRVAKL